LVTDISENAATVIFRKAREKLPSADFEHDIANRMRYLDIPDKPWVLAEPHQSDRPAS
jgi:hypothetical protein